MSSKWTNRLISKAAKLSRKDSNASEDENVNAFLYGSAGSPLSPTSSRSNAIDSIASPTITTPTIATPIIATSPKLDLEDNDNGLGEPLPPANERYALPPVRKQKGLHVGFSAEKPVLIGEGGDEATLPTIELMNGQPALRPFSPRGDAPPAIVEPPAGSDGHDPAINSLNRAPTKRQIGPGFLQKRRSFNMEEGMIQKQAPSTDFDSVSTRQGYGASLNPESAHQAMPPAVAPPPPSAQIDSLKQRQHSPLPGILRAAANTAAHGPGSKERSGSRSPAAKMWDDLLSHPELQKQKASASMSKTALAPSPTRQPLYQPRVDSYKSPPPPRFVPPEPDGHGAAPPDAYAGQSTLRRGASPTRITAPPVQVPQPNQQPAVQQMSPTSSDGSVYSASIYSPINNTIDRLMAPAQEISLSSQWDTPSTNRTTGMPAAQDSQWPLKQPQQSLPHQQPLQNDQRILGRPSAAQGPDHSFTTSPIAYTRGPPPPPQSSGTLPPPDREPRLQDLSFRPNGGAAASQPPTSQEPTLPTIAPATQALDSRQPTIPNVSPSLQQQKSQQQNSQASGYAPANREWRQMDLFPSKPDVEPPKGPLAYREHDASNTALRSTRKPPPPQLSQSMDSYQAFGGNPYANNQIQNSGSLSAGYELAPKSPRVALTPGRPPGSSQPNDSVTSLSRSQEQISRKSSKDPVSASADMVGSPGKPEFSPQIGRSPSVDTHDNSYAPRLEGPSPARSPVDPVALSIPPNEALAEPRTPPPSYATYTKPAPGASAKPPIAPPAANKQTTELSGPLSSPDFESCLNILVPAFTYSAAQSRPLVRPNVLSWLRIGSWWSLHGQKSFEGKVREQVQRSGLQAAQPDASLLQPFVNILKAWWVTERILPDMLHDQPPADPGGLHGRVLQQDYQTLQTQTETFLSSVIRRKLLPTPESLRQNLDTSFLIDYPSLPRVIRTLTSGYSPTMVNEQSGDNAFFSIVLADSPRHFSYGHLLADAHVTLPLSDVDQIMPVAISLIRERSTSHMEMVVTSQDGQIDFRIRADKGPGLSWQDVELRTRTHSIKVQMMSDFSLVIQLEKEDFKTLWGMRQYNRKVIDDWLPAQDERLIFETELHDLNYQPPEGMPSPLPVNPVKACNLRLYEKKGLSQANGPNVFSGHRVAVVSQPQIKTLSSLSQIFTSNFPVLHSYLRGEDQSPALMIHIVDRNSRATMIPSFLTDEDRMRFIDKLSSSYMAGDEILLGSMPVQSVSVSSGVPGTPADLLEIPGIQWQDLSIITTATDGDEFENGRFRIVSHWKGGSFVDRPMIRPGELKVALEAVDMTSIKLRRSETSSAILSMTANALPPGLTQPLQDAFGKKATASSTVRYRLNSLPELHSFQKMVTGYEVVYDGLCSSFTIKGQRTIAGVHKRLEASRTRLQIVKDKSGLQLLAFFRDMPDGACMSFTITKSDVFELSSLGQKSHLRFVDARFGIPKSLAEPDASFVALDLPEFAGERDDIILGFDKEEGMY